MSRSGKTVPHRRLRVEVPENVNYGQLFEASMKKQTDFHPHLMPSRAAGDYELLFSSGRSARTIPGTDEEFTLNKYKHASGKIYSQMSFMLDYTSSEYLGSSTI